MEVRLLRSGKEKELLDTIEENLENYRQGNFSYLLSDSSLFINTKITVKESELQKLDCDENDDNEVENCILIYNAFDGLTHYLARDSRLWVYLTHTYLLEYTRKRWKIPQDTEKAIHHIKNHFFVMGARGFERDNGASRLWWMADLCDRVEGLSLNEALTSLLYQYDVRANIIERPTTSLSTDVFSAIIKKLNESYNGDKKLFDRKIFRTMMRNLNLRAGVNLVSAMNEDEVSKILDECV